MLSSTFPGHRPARRLPGASNSTIGFVQRIRTYDTVLSYADVQALTAGPAQVPVPLLEPQSIALICAGLIAAAVLRVIVALVQATRAVTPRPARVSKRGA